MANVTLGMTEIGVDRSGFGALPIQRVANSARGHGHGNPHPSKGSDGCLLPRMRLLPALPFGNPNQHGARLSLLLRRSPASNWLAPEGQEMMNRIESCTECGLCKTKCPYGLDIPNLLKANLEEYRKLLDAGKPRK